MEILTKQREAVRQIDNVRKIRDKMENLISQYHKKLEEKRKIEYDVDEKHK